MRKFVTYVTYLIFFINVNNLFGQPVFISSEEFKNLKRRTLIVELLEHDNSLIETKNRGIEKAKNPKQKEELVKELNALKAVVEDYNKYITLVVNKYWDLNQKIEFKTTSEVEKLRKSKSKEFTVLFISQYLELSMSFENEKGFSLRNFFFIPKLCYSKIESSPFRPDYSYFIHFTDARNEDCKKIQYADLILSIKMMKKHIQYSEQKNLNKYKFMDYALDQAKENCSKNIDLKVYFNKALIHKESSESELQKEFNKGSLEFVSLEEINQLIESDSDAVIALLFPCNFSKDHFDVISFKFYRVFLNVRTGEILSTSGFQTKKSINDYFTPEIIKEHNECPNK